MTRTQQDDALGCYGDGAFGHNHTRTACAEVLRYYASENFESRGRACPPISQDYGVHTCAADLESDMSDDAGEEYDACDWLNEHAPFKGACWGWQDGDFGLWAVESEEE